MYKMSKYFLLQEVQPGQREAPGDQRGGGAGQEGVSEGDGAPGLRLHCLLDPILRHVSLVRYIQSTLAIKPYNAKKNQLSWEEMLHTRGISCLLGVALFLWHNRASVSNISDLISSLIV